MKTLRSNTKKIDIYKNVAEVKYENVVTTTVTTPKIEAYPNIDTHQNLVPKHSPLPQ